MSGDAFEITEASLRNSILTTYPIETLRLFKELRPEQWNRMFPEVDLDVLERKQKLRIVK